MSKKILLALLAVLLVASLCLTGCSKKAESETVDPVVTAAPAQSNAAEEAKNPDDVLVTVNGTAITRAQYEEYLGTLNTYYTNQGFDVTEATNAMYLQLYALETAVEYAALDQMVIENGLALTEDEKAAATAQAQEQWESVIADGMAYYGITDESTEEERANQLVAILAELESMGYTEESYIEEAQMYAAYDKLNALLVKDAALEEGAVEAYYSELVAADEALYKGNAAAYEETTYYNQMYMAYGMADYVVDVYYMPEGYRAVNHILLIPEDDTLVTAYTDLLATYEEQQLSIEAGTEVTGDIVTAEQVDAARQAIMAAVQPTIDEINAKLAEGAAFNDLIPLYGQDPGMSDTAAITEGYQVHMDSIMWDPVFTNAAMSIAEVGGISEPVVGSNGVHIVHYERAIPGGPVELTEEMKAEFEAQLLASAQNAAYASAISEWMGKSSIVYSAEAQGIMDAVTAFEASQNAAQ